MSGGFFRGTSADQDTRFSNKQAKLLKSQKFAPELEHLVDMTKVTMDVVKPWIASRVTELLGFEDEVLINFIYGLLDKKNVNGKEVQIQLTGFMEKNTGKFMKELWSLLLSAQKNASGVPQQFLDAKEEETRKKKAEADRITLEIQKKKELEQEKLKKMDGEVDILGATNAVTDPISKHSLRRASSAHPEEDKEVDERNGSRGKHRLSRSPHVADRSPSSHRSTHSRSISRSFSNSRSYSNGRHESRSISRSPQQRGRSSSPERRYRSPRKRTISPRRRHSPRRPRSPLRRRSPHSKRRSPSPVRRRSLSPRRRRSISPLRRRSPSPARRRSPPPMRRRSPSPPRRRSPSPVRQRSPIPVRRRSPTPPWRRSVSPPLRRRSPSPPRRRSPSPVRRRSPFPRSPKRWRRSPLRSPRRINRSRSPYRSRSPAYRSRRSLSRDHDFRTNGVESRRHRDDYASQRIRGKRSPVRHASQKEEVERSDQGRKGPDSLSRQIPISLRSPQRDPRDRSNARQKRPVLSPSPEKYPSQSESSPQTGKMSPGEDRRKPSPLESPIRQTRERVIHADSAILARRKSERITRHSPETSTEEEEISHTREDEGRRTDSSGKRIMRSTSIVDRKIFPAKDFHQEEYSPEKLARRRSAEAWGRQDDIVLRKKDQDRSEKASLRIDRPESPIQPSSHMLEDVEYGPGRIEGESFGRDERPSANQLESDSPYSSERLQKSQSRGYKADEKKRSCTSNVEHSGQGLKTESVQKPTKKAEQNIRTSAFGSDSEENEKYRSEDMKKRKHKKLGKHEMALDDDASCDSEIDERKDAKRRKKEEKRLRKEERRRRREERHRRREERRASKLKAKSMDTVTPPSDFEKNRNDADDSDGDVAARRESNPSDTEETESEQKKLEIELRKKALESLRAKKAINP